ncbi:hypothetical protein, partial [Neisseria sp.]|uniref:hypothetical protein n=1 Tax=Neisseria sp. TaxID=192066 RepID=UPI0026DD8881
MSGSKENKLKDWSTFWNVAWLLFIFILCITPGLVSFFFRNQQPSKEAEVGITIYASYPSELNCEEKVDDLKCIMWRKGLQEIKSQLEDYHKNNFKQQDIRLDNYEKNLNVITLVISLYAVLITVISIFFSLRESYRIDKGLESYDKKFDNVFKSVEDDINKAIKRYDEKINERLNKITKLEEQYNNLEGRYVNLDKKIDDVNSFLNNGL